LTDLLHSKVKLSQCQLFDNKCGLNGLLFPPHIGTGWGQGSLIFGGGKIFLSLTQLENIT
jgi:hypothetical protein